jgi:hypothetical protein
MSLLSLGHDIGRFPSDVFGAVDSIPFSGLQVVSWVTELDQDDSRIPEIGSWLTGVS